MPYFTRQTLNICYKDNISQPSLPVGMHLFLPKIDNQTRAIPIIYIACMNKR